MKSVAFSVDAVLVAILATTVIAATNASAEPAPQANSRSVPAQLQNSVDGTLDERLARDWGLRPEEWARYRQLMHT